MTAHAVVRPLQQMHGQGEGEQVPAWNVALAAHPDAMEGVQALVALSQHEPQEAAAQVPAQAKTLGAVQPACVVVEQAPVVALQQLPVHGLTVQDVVGPAKTEPAGQPTRTSIMEQAQVVVLQHAPLQANWLLHAPVVNEPGGQLAVVVHW
jgi:hypothetical protein